MYNSPKCNFWKRFLREREKNLQNGHIWDDSLLKGALTVNRPNMSIILNQDAEVINNKKCANVEYALLRDIGSQSFYLESLLLYRLIKDWREV